MNRLFIALEIPSEIKLQLRQIRESREFEQNFRWVPDANIHLTLKFIGEVNQLITDEIKTVLAFLKSFNKLECSIEKFDFLFRGKIPSILWVRLNISNEIDLIVEKINNELEPLGIVPETRKFNPHLTLLRFKDDPGKDFIHYYKNLKFDPIKFSSDEIVLFRSELNPAGAKYYEIDKYKLK